MSGNLTGRILVFALLCIAVVWAFFPILFMISSSFKPGNLIWSYPPRLIADPTIANYENIATLFPRFWKSFFNSVIVTVLTTALTLTMAISSAFVFSRLRQPWLKIPAFLMVFVRMFPGIVVVIPLYPVFNELGWLDTVTPLVLCGAAFAVSMATLLIKTFVDDIPVDLEEAAMIDGCSRVGAFTRITLPLLTPAIAAVSLVVAIGSWNEYLFPLVFTSSDARTAPVIIAIAMSNEDGVAWGGIMAMATAYLAPPLLLVLMLHKQITNVMTMGAVKG